MHETSSSPKKEIFETHVGHKIHILHISVLDAFQRTFF